MAEGAGKSKPWERLFQADTDLLPCGLVSGKVDKVDTTQSILPGLPRHSKRGGFFGEAWTPDRRPGFRAVGLGSFRSSNAENPGSRAAKFMKFTTCTTCASFTGNRRGGLRRMVPMFAVSMGYRAATPAAEFASVPCAQRRRLFPASRSYQEVEHNRNTAY